MKNKYNWKGFLTTMAIATVVYLGMIYLPRLEMNLFSYNDIANGLHNNFGDKFLWFIQDFTNAQFYASVLAGIGLIVGVWFGYYQNQKNKSLTVAYFPKIFPWIFAAQILGLAVSVFVPGYTHLLKSMDMSWVPTFIPFVSTPVIVIFVYGPNISALLTGSILSGLLSAPIGTFIIKYILDPLGLPAVSSNTFTMALVGLLVLEILNHLPWVEKKDETFMSNPGLYGEQYVQENSEKADVTTTSWFVRRVLADFTEAQFYGNEWASGLMLAGLILHFFLDYTGVYYGNDFVPLLILTSTLSSAVGVLLYSKYWDELGFFATFAPVVTVVPGLVLMVNGHFGFSILAAVLGGMIAPVLANLINSHSKKIWHPMIGNTLSMSITTVIVAMVIKALMLL